MTKPKWKMGEKGSVIMTEWEDGIVEMAVPLNQMPAQIIAILEDVRAAGVYTWVPQFEGQKINIIFNKAEILANRDRAGPVTCLLEEDAVIVRGARKLMPNRKSRRRMLKRK
jgi:hypothetical protein